MTTIKENRLAVAVATTLLVLAAGEIGARLLAPQLPDPVTWHSEEVQARVDGMRAANHADIVFVGTSLVAGGIDPEVIEERLPGWSAHTAGTTGGVPALARPWALDVVIPLLEPSVLVIGVGSFDVMDHPISLVFRDAFLSSESGRRATMGSTVLDKVSDGAASASVLWRHRSQLRQPAWLLRGLGLTPRRVDVQAAGLLPNGRSSVEENRVFDPVTGRRGGLPVDQWSLGSFQPSELRRLIADATERDITVVLVAMPTTDEFIARHPGGARDHQSYLEAASEIADEGEVTFLRFDDIREHGYFADAVHLNRRGARFLSRELAHALSDLLPPSPPIRTGSR